METSASLPLSRQLLDFFRDAEYYQRLFKLTLPLAIQNFTLNFLGMVNMMMVGQLGDTSVAAYGLANQIFFIFNLVVFGIVSGASIFTAQYWGNRDVSGIRRTLCLALCLSMLSGVVFLVIATAFPEAALGIYSTDTGVVALGSSFLRIFGWSYAFVAVTFTYAAVLRSTGEVHVPLVVSIVALGLSTVLSYGLIFGHLGMPRMGVQGAAISMLLARVVECLALVWITYRRRLPAAASLRDWRGITLPFTRAVLGRVVPVAVNELLWSLGIAAYNVIYARISTEAIAAMNLVFSIDMLAIVLFISAGNASAILVGNLIGSGEERQAYRYGGRSLSLGILAAFLMGGLILGVSGWILTFYKVSPEVIEYARSILVVVALFYWARTSNFFIFLSILRSGGDTRFAFFIDVGTIWLVGVPLAFSAAFIFGWPIQYVYLMAMVDEVTKFAIGLHRYFSKKWIQNLTYTS